MWWPQYIVSDSQNNICILNMYWPLCTTSRILVNICISNCLVVACSVYVDVVIHFCGFWMEANLCMVFIFFFNICFAVLPVGIYLARGEGWDPIYRYKTGQIVLSVSSQNLYFQRYISSSFCVLWANACTKSGPLQFSQFSSFWLILSVCWHKFCLSLWRLLGVR